MKYILLSFLLNDVIYHRLKEKHYQWDIPRHTIGDKCHHGKLRWKWFQSILVGRKQIPHLILEQRFIISKAKHWLNSKPLENKIKLKAKVWGWTRGWNSYTNLVRAVLCKLTRIKNNQYPFQGLRVASRLRYRDSSLQVNR